MLRHWSLPYLLLVFFISQFVLVNSARAEYRVFRLGVKYDEKQKKENEILTTLDDLQYVTYYKVTPNQQTRLIEHWMCRGRTDQYKKYCAKPIRPDKNKAPAPKAIAQADIKAPAQSPDIKQKPKQIQPPQVQAPATPQQIMLQ